MGMNTVVQILNDAWYEIMEDPKKFVEEIEEQMNYPEKNPLGHVKVMQPHHSSEYRAYVSGGNTIVDPARIAELMAGGFYDYADEIIKELEYAAKSAREARENYLKNKEPLLYKAEKAVKRGTR